MKEDALKFLGILNRGRGLLIGDALRNGLKKTSLVILAYDAKEATKSLYEEKAQKVLYIASKDELGHSIGYDEIAAIGIKDKKAAERVKEMMKGEEK